MKKVLKFAALLLAGAATLFSSCEPDPVEPTPVDPFENAAIEIKLVGADTEVATVAVSAEVLKVVSYIIEPAADKATHTAEDIFTNGNLVALEKDGATQIILRGLQPETNYVMHFAGRISSQEVWSEVKEFKFKTAAEPIIPVLTAKLVGTTATAAEILLNTENISRIAYTTERASETQGAPNLQVLFATGKQMTIAEQGETTLMVEQLSPNSEYVVYIAGEIAGIEEYMEQVITVKGIKTTDFAQDVNVRDIHYRGFTVDVRVDPKVKEANHVIKWATSDLFLYKKNGGGNGIDAELINTHDTAWGGLNLFNESRSLIIDEEHSYIYNSQGQVENYYYESIVPGQPQVLIMGEFRRGESDWSWGVGYYRPMFDFNSYIIDSNQGVVQDEANYWNGFYQNLRIQVQHPDPLPEDLIKVDIDTRPDDAIITVEADESIDLVSVMILSELEYNSAISMIEPEHLPWFATSLVGMYEGVSAQIDPWDSTMGLQGRFMTAISQYLQDVPRESKFWVYVIGMRGDYNGDGYLDGNEQVCKSFEFHLDAPTKPAPELEVTALESTSPFEVSFNVKCPTKDAKSGCSISNYEKEWLMTGMTGQELLDAYGDMFAFTSIELMQINSDEGLTVSYPSRPNENNYFAAMVANDEGTETFSETVIARSLPEPAAERVESELFESLKGEWTATATAYYAIYNPETEEYDPYTVEHSCDVTIGDIEYPASLEEQHYQIFERHGVSRENADKYYTEFKAAAKTFTDNTRAQNRILMNGFNFSGDVEPYFEYADPFSLFISDTYNGYTSEMPLYDFGPKWYLEVAADGSVSAPFNVNYFTPMSSWYSTSQAIYESHLIALDIVNGVPVGYMGDADGNAINGHFPVEISEDGNTITVKPLVHGGVSYYPNGAIYYGSGQYSMSVKVISEIVLTRNTSAAAQPAKANRIKGKLLKENFQCNQKIQTPARPASRTAMERIETKMVESYNNLTSEQRAEKWFEIRRNAGRR
ncbi:MAG: hypothetical protein J6R10_05700 [Tidjanibacter sp.]|nr:hypothetical protein [Tidjanibacter sp.]